MILLVTDRSDPNGGGRERYAAALASFLAAGGEAVEVCTPADARRRAASASMPVLALTPFAAATHYQLHGGRLAAAFAAERQSMRSALRRALFDPGLALNRRRQRLLAEESRVFAGSAALMAFSERSARELDVDPARIVVSRPGVDLARFTPDETTAAAAPDSRPLQLAFVAHNFALKGLATAVAALARVRRAGLDSELVVAGHGSARPFAALAREEGVADRVSFVGALGEDALIDLYRRADALLHPTFYDPFPRVVVEALACGCPPITTARCGAAEILADGRDGLVIDDPRDDQAAAAAIERLAALPRRPLRQAAAALGRRFDAAAHFRSTFRWLSTASVAAVR
jgi:glycosyltransferase involved in cell wall biosynthesis